MKDSNQKSLNTAQIELLEMFIAEEGIYFKAINRCYTINLGTKVLFLERAISMDDHTFSQSLDKLFMSNLTGSAKTANIEFIQALKLINDLCFNNVIKLRDDNTCVALTHYFGNLGDVNPDEFQAAVQTIINTNIDLLHEHSEETITAQKEERLAAETKITQQRAWRNELKFPLEKSSLPVKNIMSSFRLACANGNIDQAQSIWKECREEIRQDIFKSNDFYTFRIACKNNQLHIAKWLWQESPFDQQQQYILEADDFDVYRWAFDNQDKETAKWLSNEQQRMYPELPLYAFRTACKKGKLDHVKLILNNSKERHLMLRADDFEAFRIASKHDNEDIARWLWHETRNTQYL